MIFGKKEDINKLKEEINQLKKEIEELKKQNKEYLDGWKRAKADYINREREIEKEKSEWIEFATKDLVLKILPIYENLNKSLEYQETQKEALIEGLKQIKKQFDEFLKDLGIEKIKTLGEKFNPELHEAVEKRGESDEIVEEVSTGYKMNGKVIKVAKVIVK